jgi:hypothetical protein
MQEALNDLEARLDKLLGKGSPYQMSDKAKRSLAGATWVIALVIGLLQAWSALALWQLGHAVNTIVSYSNYLAASYGSSVVATQLGLFFYLSLIVIIIDAALLLLAVPALKEFRKHGWNLLYYSLLVNVVYGLVRSFSNVGGGLGQFILQLFFSAVVGYFLFQIRGLFTADTAIHTPVHEHRAHGSGHHHVTKSEDQ